MRTFLDGELEEGEVEEELDDVPQQKDGMYISKAIKHTIVSRFASKQRLDDILIYMKENFICFRLCSISIRRQRKQSRDK
jgi:hypothetical protein